MSDTESSKNDADHATELGGPDPRPAPRPGPKRGLGGAEVDPNAATWTHPAGPEGTETVLGGPAEPRLAPRRIGPYRILSTLGEGGMGCVYLAEQTEPVERRVAVKLIRSSLTSPGAVARFQAERQAMARLSHPAIAQIFEAGTTDDGFPFFVMEHIPGEPLTRFCDRHRLDLEQRLRLFTEICRGVEHAHRKGILHRDLKPSNVLVAEVDGEAVPKVIDFGIARAIDQPLTEATLLTQGAAGTPAYMSPEAFELVDGQADLDTRADVYALGVMLYELLTGTRPIDLRGASLSQTLQKIANEEPARPSTRVRSLKPELAEPLARARRSDPETWPRHLDGDLDWITARAMAKERDQRYGSASELADDLRRHLDLEPVLAGPPTLRYRGGRFVRRNRALVLAASLTLLALVLGTIGTTVGLVQARREAQRANQEAERANQALLDAEEVTRFLVHLFEVSDPREAGGESVSARQLLDRGAARIEAELADQPLRRARMMLTMGEIYVQLQSFQEAQRLLAGAQEVRRAELPEDHPDLAEALFELAAIERNLARYEAAESAARQALAIREQHFGPEHESVGEVLRELAVILYLSDRHEEAEPLVQRALAIARQRLGPEDPAVAASLETLGNLIKDQGRCADALPHLTEALAIRQARLDPLDPRLATAMNNLGSCHGETGDLVQARGFFERALEIQERHLGPDATAVAIGRTNLGIVYRSLGELDAAEATLEAARDGFLASVGPDHPMTANPVAELGVLLATRGRLEEAESHLRQALAVWQEKPGPSHPFTAWAHWGLANVLRDAGQTTEAETHYLRALEIREQALPPEHPEIRQNLKDYARLLRATGRPERAAELEARAEASDPN